MLVMKQILRVPPLVARIGVPLLLFAAWATYIQLDQPGAATRWPSVTLCTIAVALATLHLITNRRRPKKLLGVAVAVFAVSLLVIAYSIDASSGFEGLALYVYLGAPLFALGLLLTFISLYVDEPGSAKQPRRFW